MSDGPDELAKAAFPARHLEADDDTGHRQRVRKRFLWEGGDALEDYELLEPALQLVVSRLPGRWAKTLLRQFGSFSPVFNASEPRLSEIKALGETTMAHIKVIQAVAAHGPTS